MQQLWLLKSEWDDPLPPFLQEKWGSFLKDLPALKLIRMPRQLCPPGSQIELHGFSDASDFGYCCVIYFRFHTPDGKTDTSLIIAKSKVAPLKRINTPRLELQAATLLSTLLTYVVPHLRQSYTLEDIYNWSDSTTTLQWIQTPSYKLKTFTANRVASIQENFPEARWGYVKSSENPADLGSRGVLASKLLENDLWWKGPPWLRSPHSSWPSPSKVTLSDESEVYRSELRETRWVLVTETCAVDIFSRISDWDKLQRILAYVFRFKHNALNPKDRRTGPLIPAEFKAAERVTVRKAQIDSFKDDIKRLKANKESSTRLRRLNPFLDPDGLIRVGGRLSHAPISADRKHPLILPKSHALTKSLIKYFHVTFLHAGPQLLQSLLFQRYWILAGRAAIKSVLQACLPCFRINPTNRLALMGDLPDSRVTPSRVFESTGVDYAGPFKVKASTLRFAREVKTYLCVFICMSTKAVHLELAQDLTADTFIAALTRFSPRRGAPSDLYSDCGTQFTGASRELKQAQKALVAELKDSPELTKMAQNFHIRFHFNAPAAPHMGGLWEAAVKSSKAHLARVIHGQLLTFTELDTLICRIEAMLNSRPLTPLSSDPSDLTPLTPAHFIIGSSIATPVERIHGEKPLTSLKRWHRVQAMAQSLWRRWSLEYLHTLQSRAKWNKVEKNLQIDDLVLLHDPQLPPYQWQLGRVTETFPGKDGHVRVATVRTATGEYKRPVVKLYPLPISDEETLD
ncbi:uncharacterized protein [Bemisia tabaci]|uniref:uncharacterized protein n=1 Tax=Bemisia tabaci TaxID=7038 RepID=UPI003B28D1A5